MMSKADNMQKEQNLFTSHPIPPILTLLSQHSIPSSPGYVATRHKHLQKMQDHGSFTEPQKPSQQRWHRDGSKIQDTHLKHRQSTQKLIYECPSSSHSVYTTLCIAF